MCLQGTVQLLMWSSAWGVHDTLLHQLPATGQDVFSELGTSLYCRPTADYRILLPLHRPPSCGNWTENDSTRCIHSAGEQFFALLAKCT